MIKFKIDPKCGQCKHIRSFYERKHKYFKCIKLDYRVKTDSKPWCKNEHFELRKFYLIKELCN